MSSNICSILVNSCDKYEEAWHPFFTLFRRYYKDCPYPVYLNTETMKCQEQNVETINSCATTWSSRLIYALRKIDSKYVIQLLDDFFLMDNVQQTEVDKVIDIMEKDDDIAVFYFKHSTGQSSDVIEHGNYILMDNSKKYILNFQAGVWRREVLIELLSENQTAWEIEENPSPLIDSKYKFYCSKSSSYTSCQGDVFPYLWALRAGYGICKSKWLWNNKKLFKKEGIKVNFKKLGTMSKFSYDYGVFKQKVKSKFQRLVKL